MARGCGATVGLALLGLGLGLALAVIVLAVVLSRHQAPCGPQAFAHAAVAADSKVCSDIGRAILQQQGSPVDATIAALVCTSVVNPQSMGLGGGVIFTIYNVTTGKVEVINARETVPARHAPSLLDRCAQALPLGRGAQWIGVPGELRGYAEAHRRHGRLPWAQLFQPTIALLRGGHVVAPVLSQFLHNGFLRPSLQASTLRQLFFNGTEPLRPQDPLPWPALATTLETVATEGAEVFYTGRLGQMLVEDIAKEGSQLTLQDLAKFQPEVVDALEVPLGDYTLYSPPPPAGGAILSFILNVLRGFNFSAESVARPEGRVNMYHHLVETLKFARGQRWRLGDPRSHPKLQLWSDGVFTTDRHHPQQRASGLMRAMPPGFRHYPLTCEWRQGGWSSRKVLAPSSRRAVPVLHGALHPDQQSPGVEASDWRGWWGAHHLCRGPGGTEGTPRPWPEPDPEVLLLERGPGRVPGGGLCVCRLGPEEGWGGRRLLRHCSAQS
nr:glutathione hydrolase 5 proenzyme isoform X8 [Chlorocebus sabaeus]